MISAMTSGERVRAALKGNAVDRVPVCFWHHFQPDGSGERLATLTKDFFVDKFQLDIVKIMPDLPYPAPGEPINQAGQMRFLPRLDLDTPSFQEQLSCIRRLRATLAKDQPLILTLFSPLTYTFQFLGKARAIAMLRQDTDFFQEGLGTIAANLRRLMEAALNEGADGIFFSCMGATNKDLKPGEYKHIARVHDVNALIGARQGWLNVIHIHAEPDQPGDQIYFDLFSDYPWTSVLSWSDRLTGPSLAEAIMMTDKCLMGGLWERGPIVHGSEREIDNEIMAAVTQTKGRRLILANGCSIPDDASEKWLSITRRLVDQLH